MKRIVLAVLMLASACSTPAREPSPPAAPPAPAPPPPKAQPVADACSAREYQHLVGRPRSEVPVPVRPELQRVACTTCAVTMDFNERRLNFFFDAQTGLIKEVRCG